MLAPKSICSTDKAKEVADGDARHLVIDGFVPASATNALSDVVIGHGGQGTVQCVLTAGKPIVAIALQVEQQINLDNAMNAGAAIRTHIQSWRAKNIYNAVLEVLQNPRYAASARDLSEALNREKMASVRMMLRCLPRVNAEPRAETRLQAIQRNRRNARD